VYHGPDTDYTDREICFGSNETHVSIADVTDKDNPAVISMATYPGASYVHQGWLTEDHRYFVQDDELDETAGNPFTHTFIWDVSDLDEPELLTTYIAGVTSTDHNLYIRGNYAYQANYSSGLRILDLTDIANPVEVAHFDTHPRKDLASNFDGAWSVYPFFPSGTVAVSSRAEGLFLLRPTGFPVANEREDLPGDAALLTVYPNPFRTTATFGLDLDAAQHVQVGVYDLLGRLVATVHDGPLSMGSHPLTFDGTGLPAGLYLIRATGEHFRATQTMMHVP
jgi:hypothetical protein